MRNNKVVFLSLIALVSMVLTFTVNWMFIILAVILSGAGWKILFDERKK